jgi:hypothetical protein
MIIKSGNPFGESAAPASYTRFILPFAYEIQGKADAKARLKWEADLADNLPEIHWRKQYFTSEVADVLFKKAKWYVLKEDGEDFHKSFVIKRPDKELIDIEMNPPQLVLFQKDSKSKFLNTGFLILEIYFPKNKEVSFDDLLFVNENLRYKEQIFEGHREKICNLFSTPGEVEKLFTQNEPSKINHYFDLWHYLLQKPITGEGDLVKIEGSIQHLRPKKDRAEWDIYADARTFVWTCAVTNKGAEALQNEFCPTSSEKWEAHNYGHWIKLLNVDSPSMDQKFTHEQNQELTHKQIRQFERDWAKERTYHRWEEKVVFPNCYYGFSYHSGAALISDCPEPPLWKHWGAMYFDMALLLFYLRVTLFRFSSELTEISSKASCKENKDSQIELWRIEFNDLRWEFTLFTNLYQYPLISNQQQGLEMYELARKSLDINELFQEIQDEIHNGHEFIHKEVQNTQSETALSLNRIATIGLALSIVLVFLGLDFGKDIILRVKENSFVMWLTNKEITDAFYRNDWLVITLLTAALVFLIFAIAYLWKHPIGWIYRVFIQPIRFKVQNRLKKPINWLESLFTKERGGSKKK